MPVDLIFLPGPENAFVKFLYRKAIAYQFFGTVFGFQRLIVQDGRHNWRQTATNLKILCLGF